MTLGILSAGFVLDASAALATDDAATITARIVLQIGFCMKVSPSVKQMYLPNRETEDRLDHRNLSGIPCRQRTRQGDYVFTRVVPNGILSSKGR